jgi:hypothetical protein
MDDVQLIERFHQLRLANNNRQDWKKQNKGNRFKLLQSSQIIVEELKKRRK